MRDEGVTADWLCRECGREIRMSELRCEFCSAPRLGATGIAAEPGPARRSPAEADEDYPRLVRSSPFHWQLPALTTTLLIVVCVLLIVAYGVGLALLVALIPALIFLFPAPIGNDRRKISHRPRPEQRAAPSA